MSNFIPVSEEQKNVIFSDPVILPYLKTPAQGAATSVWAAVAKALEGRGGKYLESLQEIGEWTGPEEKRIDWTDPGYAKYIYDNDKEDKLWKLSKDLVG